MSRVTKLKCCTFVVAVTLAGLSGCNKTETPAQTQAAAQAPDSTVAADSDPAAGNLAPVSSAPASIAPEQIAQNYAPDSSTTSYDLPTNTQDYPADYAYDTASNQQPVYAEQPPPPLPEYNQPPCPGDGYYWTPGYWGYAPDSGYYWVPGVWVLAPWVNALWTPPYWDYEGNRYLWHAGYWGPHIGFYGGIDYGFGYTGRGYYGAYWDKGQLRYNREVTSVVPGVVGNVYGYQVPRSSGSRVSYNGGRGGINVRPTPQEMAVVHDPRTPPVVSQVQHARQASTNRAQFAASGHAPEALAGSAPLAATYKAPAARPPAAAMRMATRPAPVPAQPAIAQHPVPENRPAPQQRPAPEVRQAPAPQQRPAPEVRQAPAPQQRPAPEVRQAPAPQQRPAPEVRQAPAPQQRPAPEVRQAPAPQQRPAPAPRPAPEARPAPAAPRPAPEARPAPPAPRPAPAAPPARPAPPVKPEDDKKKG